MKKLLRLQSALLKEIDKYEKIVPERDHFIDWEHVHIVSCAKIGYMMAEERGVDPIIAAASCACHDYGRIITGKQQDHARVHAYVHCHCKRNSQRNHDSVCSPAGVS